MTTYHNNSPKVNKRYLTTTKLGGEPKRYYGFYARMNPESASLIAQVHNVATVKYGRPLSHPLLLEELLLSYLDLGSGAYGDKGYMGANGNA